MGFNLSTALLDEQLEKGFGDRPALIEGGRLTTYAQLLEKACRFANALETLGIRAGDRVILNLPDSIDWAVSFLGCVRLGALPVPLNTWMPGADYEYFFADSGARVLVLGGEAAREQARHWTRFGDLEHVLISSSLAGGAETLRFGAETRRPQVSRYDEVLASGAPRRAPPQTREDDPAFWLYSSGTTGRPKGAVHRQHSMIFSADHYASEILALRPGEVVFSAAKLFFAYGLGNSLCFPLRHGAVSVLYPGRSTPDAMFQILSGHRPAVFFCVPTLYAAMLERGGENVSQLASLRLCVSAGEPLPAEIFLRWKERFGVEILDGIGSTEMAHIFLSNTSGRVRPGSTGRPVAGYRLRVLDEDGREVPRGEIGSLWVRGESAFREYWGNQEATEAVQRSGWVATGDKYRADEEGFYWYAGRGDDMLKVSGLWVSPFEVESVVIEHPAVRECAVVGVEDAHGLVKPCAFVVPSDGEAPSDEMARSIQDFVKSRLAPYKYPRHVRFTDTLPKTATGKIQRYKLRERAREDGIGS